MEMVRNFLSINDVSKEELTMLLDRAAELKADLNADNAARLGAFRRFVNDQEFTAMQKVSFALSGWFLGSNNATENFAVSESFFQVRDLVVEYLATANASRRREILI